MLTLKDAIPCSICGENPILRGGLFEHTGRLVCPNFKSKKIEHGNLNVDRSNLTMGFTHWNNNFWSEKQMNEEGIPQLVEEWNTIHTEHITNEQYHYFKHS